MVQTVCVASLAGRKVDTLFLEQEHSTRHILIDDYGSLSTMLTLKNLEGRSPAKRCTCTGRAGTATTGRKTVGDVGLRFGPEHAQQTTTFSSIMKKLRFLLGSSALSCLSANIAFCNSNMVRASLQSVRASWVAGLTRASSGPQFRHLRECFKSARQTFFLGGTSSSGSLKKPASSWHMCIFVTTTGIEAWSSTSKVPADAEETETT